VSPLAPLALSPGRIALLLCVVLVGAIALAVEFAAVDALTGDDDGPERTNCPACGARTATDAEACEYCGEPVDSTRPHGNP
jgi:hypothetical protein